jgi:hypothetical protein
VEGDSIIMSLPVSERLMAPTSGAETSAAEALKLAAEKLERLAFSIPAPNSLTPQLMMLAVGMRQVAYRELNASLSGKRQ